MQRQSKRIGGKVVKGYVVDGCFYRTKKEAGIAHSARKQHYAKPNPMQGLIGYAAMYETDVRELADLALSNLNGPQTRNGLPSISLNRLLDMAHHDSVLYSTNHPDSVNGPVYDAALTMLLQLFSSRLEDWAEEYSWESKTSSPSIDGLMQELGYDTTNSAGSISNSLNVVVTGAKVFVGADANREWLRLNGLTALRR